MNNVRLGIVGVGNIGTAHARSVLAGKIPRLTLSAVADHDPARLALFPDVKHFATGEAMFASGEVDAVIIATPHYSHTALGIAALKTKAREKPARGPAAVVDMSKSF